MEDDLRFSCATWRRERLFQSTSPVWRTTFPFGLTGDLIKISIHVPRVEDDTLEVDDLDDAVEFQSTSPVWRTTTAVETSCGEGCISIHVPRVEDDEPEL